MSYNIKAVLAATRDTIDFFLRKRSKRKKEEEEEKRNEKTNKKKIGRERRMVARVQGFPIISWHM